MTISFSRPATASWPRTRRWTPAQAAPGAAARGPIPGPRSAAPSGRRWRRSQRRRRADFPPRRRRRPGTPRDPSRTSRAMRHGWERHAKRLENAQEIQLQPTASGNLDKPSAPLKTPHSLSTAKPHPTDRSPSKTAGHPSAPKNNQETATLCTFIDITASSMGTGNRIIRPVKLS